MQRYNPKDIEPKWQQAWEDQKLHEAIDFDEKPKFVMLTEFPYPSGDGLHLGHAREYTLGDIIARHKRMTGHNVLYPMGFDAFGLPTENYAIKNKVSPQSATDTNVENFIKQFKSLGYGMDWNRCFKTTDPEYYKWTQWLFLQFYKSGLAYQDEIAINWCPKCKTGLANEEVVGGLHERCDTPVEKKFLKQWLLKITKYADRLIDGLATVDYPSRIADQQINWIGRSIGAEVEFEVPNAGASIKVFTTRPDTLFGATFLVLAPEHPLIEQLTDVDNKAAVEDYIRTTAQKSEIERQETNREKTGVHTGAYAINPASGEQIPIWIADYVLVGYGTGAIMAVPAHDERDFAFAQKFDLPITRVIQNDAPDGEPTAHEGIMINSGLYDGQKSQEVRNTIIKDLADQNLAEERVNYKLRDWIFSRQHYWGEPIPIIHCVKDGPVAVPESDLPVELPHVERYEPTDNGESPLAEIADWVETICPVCGGPAKRETDTMPNWAGSSWYYLRYFDPRNNEAFAAENKLAYWQNVDLYLGGMEHTTLHLLYSRFWHQFLYDQGLVPTPEPYVSRRGQGIVLAADGTKMSKSKGNIVNPTEIIDQGYGADALRLAIAFLAPYDQTTPWSPDGVAGTYRFLQRTWNLTHEVVSMDATRDDFESAEIEKVVHSAIAKVSIDLHHMRFNTAIAALMELSNQLYKLQKVCSRLQLIDALVVMMKLLAPFAPHIAEELWAMLGKEGSVHRSEWPVHDPELLTADTVTVVVQINGKVRAELSLPSGSNEADVVELAHKNEKTAQYLGDNPIRKTIYVPDKLVNFVI